MLSDWNSITKQDQSRDSNHFRIREQYYPEPGERQLFALVHPINREAISALCFGEKIRLFLTIVALLNYLGGTDATGS